MDELSAYISIIFFVFRVLLMIGVLILGIVGRWKAYEKGGKPGWAAWIPFYSQYCAFDIAFGNGWLFLLLLIPAVNFILLLILWMTFAKVFGKGALFGLALMFFNSIAMPVLGFGSARYLGPYVRTVTYHSNDV